MSQNSTWLRTVTESMRVSLCTIHPKWIFCIFSSSGKYASSEELSTPGKITVTHTISVTTTAVGKDIFGIQNDLMSDKNTDSQSKWINWNFGTFCYSKIFQQCLILVSKYSHPLLCYLTKGHRKPFLRWATLKTQSWLSIHLMKCVYNIILSCKLQ